MLKVGITGGIGSGKTTVCTLFELLGIPVFYADETARALMESNDTLRASISNLFGNHIYPAGRLDRPALAAAVFGNAEKLGALNALVHPVTIDAAKAWMEKQSGPYAIKEAALFFESGSNTGMDVMIGVWAPEDLRIARVAARSTMSEAQVRARMAQQMEEEEKMRRCDFVIQNDDRTAIIPHVLELHSQLMLRS